MEYRKQPMKTLGAIALGLVTIMYAVALERLIPGVIVHNNLMAWLYVIAGALLIAYPMTLVVRVRDWEVAQKRAGKSVLNGFIILPIATFGFFLGGLMFVLGSEILKGTIKITL